jgi:hypothetical protein
MNLRKYLDASQKKPIPLNEAWRIKQGYAGRGLIKSYSSPNVIIFSYLTYPEKIGLLWLAPDGLIRLGNKTIGKISGLTADDFGKSATHKKIIADTYYKIGLGNQPGNLRDNVEKFYEKNIRGRIVNDEMWFYESDYSGTGLTSRDYDKLMDTAIREIMRYIPDNWWTKKLSEEETPTYRLLQFLNRDCKQFKAILKSPSEPYLYRGSNKFFEGWTAIMPRKNRKPTDMPEHIHELMDTQFYEYFGWRARSEGVFVTGDMTRAEYYGRADIFIPVDGFSYLWNPEIGDLYTFLKKREIFWRDVWSVEKQLEKYVAGYKKTGLADAEESGNEIIFRCRKYYLVETKHREVIYDWAHSR